MEDWGAEETRHGGVGDRRDKTWRGGGQWRLDMERWRTEETRHGGVRGRED
jgi:hypothetical protein